MLDVARRAGVSIATVSRALRGETGVSSFTRERIRQAADELSYVISPEASGLSSGHTDRVAVVVPQLDTWFHGSLLASMAPVLHAAGLEMLVYQVNGPEQRARFLRDLPARRKADALIMTALPLDQTDLDRLDLMGTHVVVTGGRMRDYPHVGADDLLAGRLAVQHLVDLGHRRIGMVRPSDADVTPAEVLRVRAWRETLAAAGLDAPDELLVTDGTGVASAPPAVAHLLALRHPPTAVFACSDELAIAAMAHLHAMGRRVPDDVSVTAVDGHPLGELLGLTTVDQDVVAQGTRAAELAVRLIRGERVADVEVAVRLIERQSTGRPPG